MDDLFKRLQTISTADPQESRSTASKTASQSYREPSVSSPVYSPAPLGSQPHHASNVLSPNTSAMNTPQPEVAVTRTADLLSLLKFRQTSSATAKSPLSAFDANSLLDAAGSASDLLSFKSLAAHSPSTISHAASRPEPLGQASGSSGNPQDFLLKLLNQAPKSVSLELPSQSSPSQDDGSSGVNPSSHPAMATAGASNSPLAPQSFTPSQTTGPAQRKLVSEAVAVVGEDADKQSEDALVRTAQKAHGNSASEVPVSSSEKQAVEEAAAELCQDLKDDENKEKLEVGMPKEMAKTFEETLEVVATGAQTGADEEDWDKAAGRGATTFTLPMQPFKAIRILQLDKEPSLIPQAMVMDIARVKRPFDQIDRNLVAATQNLMIYPLRNGGLRVIRQETGVHKEVFKQVQERIFSIAVSTGKKPGAPVTELVLGIGVDGSVFWAPLSGFATSDDADAGDGEAFRGFVFPPVPFASENTSGGQLKSRVRPSSRHPEFFAYGRGKSIYIVYPSIARSAAYFDRQSNICRSEKYLREHMLRVSTGKAGKDFIFSADDTLLISLDKAGRLKFWDIRHLLAENYEKNHGATVPLELKTPLMTFATCPATEKSWPTSIHLVDKEKPMTKGIALRYVIVGLNQNHTLQLWDLMLGKPVQEIHFPHEQESDAICSVVFHPKTSILTVAHPTRNTIYFLHLSIPPYSLSPMNQSKFIGLVAEKNDNLPTPQSTIIVNGVREYKFSLDATIRSVDILADPGAHYGDDPPAFVLYIMHSNGIMELKVDRTMLGLAETNRLVHGISALDVDGAIRVEGIRPLPPAVAGDAGSVTSETTCSPPSNGIDEARKGGRKADQSTMRLQKAQDKDAESSNDRTSEKKKKKERKAPPSNGGEPAPSTSMLLEPPTQVRQSPTRIIARRAAEAPASTDFDHDAAFDATQDSFATPTSHNAPAMSHSNPNLDFSSYQALLKVELENLQKTLKQERIEQDAAANGRQEAVLKVVSRTLTENVEDSLSRIVTDGLTKVTVSPLKDAVTGAIERQLSTSFNQAMKVGVPRELQKSLPMALQQVMKNKTLTQTVADQVTDTVIKAIHAQFTTALQSTITPAISKLAVNAVKQMTSDIERQFGEHIQALNSQHLKDNNTITNLNSTVHVLHQTIIEMARTQQKHQQEILDLFAELKSTSLHAHESVSVPMTTVKDVSPAERERVHIQEALTRNEVEDATLRWMHSDRKIELFDEVFLYVDPRFLTSLSSLLILSVAATVSEDFSSHLRERLRWVEMCLSAISAASIAELQDVLPNVLDVILQRVQQSYMQVSQKDCQNPLLKDMHHIARKINELKTVISPA